MDRGPYCLKASLLVFAVINAAFMLCRLHLQFCFALELRCMLCKWVLNLQLSSTHALSIIATKHFDLGYIVRTEYMGRWINGSRVQMRQSGWHAPKLQPYTNCILWFGHACPWKGLHEHSPCVKFSLYWQWRLHAVVTAGRVTTEQRGHQSSRGRKKEAARWCPTGAFSCQGKSKVCLQSSQSQVDHKSRVTRDYSKCQCVTCTPVCPLPSGHSNQRRVWFTHRFGHTRYTPSFKKENIADRVLSVFVAFIIISTDSQTQSIIVFS